MQHMNLFDLTGKNAVITGGGGTLGGAIAEGLAAAGARVAVTSRNVAKAQRVADRINEQGGDAHAYALDVHCAVVTEECKSAILADFEHIDILVNGVGGNLKEATTSEEQSFFQLPGDAFNQVMDLNLAGGVIVPSQIFVNAMLKNEQGGSIINVTSMNAFRPLTRIPGYSAAKAAVSNFTQWFAVHLAQEYSTKLRVNAIAPGFFLTDQNRFLLTDEATGAPTPRGKTIIDHTPLGRYGDAEELIGAAIWLASDASKFVTGTVIPVDGGFSAFSGV